MRKLIGSLLVLSILSIVLTSGCTQTPSGGDGAPPVGGSTAICGNGALEQGEQCDGTECSTGQYCNDNCQCVTNAKPDTSLGLDAAGDCTLLTPEDVMNVCGVNTTAEIQEPRTDVREVCETMLRDPIRKPHQFVALNSVVIRYVEDDDIENGDAKTLVNNLVKNLGAEKLTDYAAYIPFADNFTVVYGTKYRIEIRNYPSYPICTNDQIKELAKLVSKRIYG